MSAQWTRHTQNASDASDLSEATAISEDSNLTTSRSSTPSVEFPETIPVTHPARTLVLCFDGTGDQFDSDNSNVVEFCTMLKKDDRTKQMVYYQSGIGTYSSPQVATPFAAKISRLLDEAVAWNLSAHVMDGYEFLMQNYIKGDRICIFGFSRGAYTARGLAGMIHKVGLLPAGNYEQVPFAYKMYKRVDEVGWKQSNAFKKAFAVDVPIEFIGVWDTVSSVGLIPHSLPFTTSNTIVRTFRHAVSLDERRAKFQTNLWNRPTAKERTLGLRKKTSSMENLLNTRRQSDALRALERKYNRRPDRPTDVEEVWFAGGHCDVGGGNVDNGTSHSLARISLRWMIRECFKANTGIMFTTEGIHSSGIDPENLYPIFQPKRPGPIPTIGLHIRTISPSQRGKQDEMELSDSVGIKIAETEEEHEVLDALSPMYDKLCLSWIWWILEFLPIEQWYQRSNNAWATYFGWNLGRGRVIPHQEKTVKIHRSVKVRMDAQLQNGRKYIPKASFQTALDLGNVEWVD